MAPIVLYPDPLVAQILAAATYPLEIVEARSWLKKNSGRKSQDLVQAAAKQDWDPSTQSLAAHNPYFRRAVLYSSAAVAGPYGAGRAVATPYGAAAGVRTPRGAAGANSGLNGAAAGIRTTGAAAGAISGPNGAAAEIRTPGGSAGAVAMQTN